jgi:choice-of-anchor C domain-containing protein
MRILMLGALAVLWYLAPGTCSAVPNPKPKPRSGNLLINGSFEEGPEPGMFKPLDVGSTAIKGWTVTRGQIDYIGAFWQAADGKRSIDLHGSPGYGGIAQTFATDKGQKYRVTFALSCTPGTGEKKIAVRAAGKKSEFRCDGSKTTKQDMRWVTHSWEFTAVSDRTTLEIHTLETTDPEQGPALDNVSVVAVRR